MHEIERRFYPLADTVELRQDGDERTLTWVSPPYDTWSPVRGDMQEQIAAGAFEDSRDDVIATWEHDNRMIFGRVSAGTLKISDREDGAHHEATLSDRSYERDLIASVERREVVGASFEFITMEDKWEKFQRDEDSPTVYRRTVLKARRLQGGPVARPFYGDESVALRSLDGWKAANSDGEPLGVVLPVQAMEWYERHLQMRKRQMELC